MGKGIAVIALLASGTVVALIATQTSEPARAETMVSMAPTTRATEPVPLGTAAQETIGSPEQTTSVSSVATTVGVATARAAPPGPAPVEPSIDSDTEMLAHDAYFRWFDSIYRDDREALAAAVGTREMYEAGTAAMENDSIAFNRVPTLDNVVLTIDEVLLVRPDCVVVVVTDDLSGFIDVAVASRTVIDVYWPDIASGSYRMAAQWGAGTPTSMWRVDCDQRIRGFTP